MERHRHRHTEICKLRGTNTLRQTPSSKKGHTLLRLKYTHTHTETEKRKQSERATHSHTERDIHAQRERRTMRERQKYM